MDLGIFLQGLLIGFSISVPVGPVGVIVIRRTLAEGFASGLMSGVGCATGMAIYGSVIGFGLTAISDLLLRYQRPLAVVGGLFLIYLGYTIVRAAPPEPTSSPQRNSLFSAYASTFALTIFNPAVILYFLAIRSTGVAVAIFLSYLAPVYLAFVAPRILKERTEPVVYAALAIGLALLNSESIAAYTTRR